MKRQRMKKRLRASVFGLMCLLLFLGTKNEGCSGCSDIEGMLETQYGTLKVLIFLDLHDYPMVRFEAEQLLSKDDLEKNPGIKPDSCYCVWLGLDKDYIKKLKAGTYSYAIHAKTSEEREEKLRDAGVVTVQSGKTVTIKIR